MATKSYSKHKEYKQYASSGNTPYGDDQFDMLKSELMPKSKLDSLGRSGHGAREYHYEYKEEKHPSGKYDRKDLHTVEEYTIPPKSTPKSNESSSYYYEREERELPAITNHSARSYNYENTSSTPGYSKVKSTKVSKDVTQNVDELDSLLDDLQRDQERQLYKSGYASDTAESSSFDYRRGTPAKAPSSGYSTLKKEERVETSSWGSSPLPAPTVARQTELRQEMYREEKESRVIPAQVSPAIAHPVPAPVCAQCHHSTGTLSRSSTPMNKVTTTVKTYTYEVPADQDPTTVPLPNVAAHERTYVSTNENVKSNTTIPPSPSLGCQYCSHCNSRVTSREYTKESHLAPPVTTTHHYHVTSSTDDRTNERIVYPKPLNEPSGPVVTELHPQNGHGPYNPTSYKYSETTYSAHNTMERFPPSASPAPFPRPVTPSPSTQQPPKKLDDLLADFPEARFPTQPDGVVQRKVEVTHERSTNKDSNSKPAPPIGTTKNVNGPAVYYPPGHTPFAKKEVAGYQSSAMQGGGAYASGRGMYEYEGGSKSKEKHSEKKTAVPICLPLCCAMPCVIM